jgi:hypothetical protein
MAPLVVGIILLVLIYVLPVPYVLWLIGMIVGIVLILYGLWVLFNGYRSRGVGPSGRRWW